MEFLRKLEKQVLSWTKSVPHLPPVARKWLGENAWWIVMIGTVIGAIAFLFAIFGLFTLITLINSISAGYYVTGTYTPWHIVTSLVSIIFSLIVIVLSGMSIKPLQNRVKQGWVLLFAVWLINIVSIVVSAILSLTVFGFIFRILFGAIGVIISGYLLFEIHGEFAHDAKVVKSTKKA